MHLQFCFITISTLQRMYRYSQPAYIQWALQTGIENRSNPDSQDPDTPNTVPETSVRLERHLAQVQVVTHKAHLRASYMHFMCYQEFSNVDLDGGDLGRYAM